MEPHDANEIAAVATSISRSSSSSVWVLGLAFRRVRQPAAVAEIVAGLDLGPSASRSASRQSDSLALP